ncbi:hypothetical protein Q31b_38930 [Novipirellula aureliae]|uniref:Uncharacterized protein n=1 Tax=Novipirellula aureliae TaxID=2527966 RepID=A0A5C6DRI2_9BACT|nr:hypothetical protein Q31b_38930 [Novipirellula aureliae]
MERACLVEWLQINVVVEQASCFVKSEIETR